METRHRISAADLLAAFDVLPETGWFYFESLFPLEYQCHDYQVGQPKFRLLTPAQRTLKVCQYIQGCTLDGGLQSAFYQHRNAVPHLPDHVRAFGWNELTNRFMKCLRTLIGDAEVSAWVAKQNAEDLHASRVHERYWGQEALTEEDEQAYERIEQEEALRNSWGNAGLLENESDFEAFNEWFYRVAPTTESRAAVRRFVEARLHELIV